MSSIALPLPRRERGIIFWIKRIGGLGAIGAVLAGGIVGAGIYNYAQHKPLPIPQTAPGTANIFIDQNGGSCVTSATAIPYAGQGDSNSCSSMQAAQTAMSGGQKAVLACGAYPTQTLSSSQKATATTFEAAVHDSPTDFRSAYTMTTCATIGGNGLTITIDKVHIVGIEATPTPHNFGDGHVYQFQDSQNCINTTNCSNDATHPGMLSICPNTRCDSFTDILIDGWKGGLATLNASGTTFDHGNMGDFDVCYLGSLNSYAHVVVQPNNFTQTPGLGGDVMHAPWPQVTGNPGSSNVIIRNSVFHDDRHGLGNSEPLQCTVSGTPTDGAHADMIQGLGCVSNCVIENSAFFNGGDKPIQWSIFGGVTAFTGATVKNNFFDNQFNTFSSFGQDKADCSGLFWQNNLGQGPNVVHNGNTCTTAAVTISNNIEPFTHTTCVAGGSGAAPLINFSHNIYGLSSTVTCGSGGNASIKCTPQWVNSPGYSGTIRNGPPSDLTLASGDTCAQNFSDAAFPTKDWIGTNRPQGSGADAGPSEIGSSINTGVSLASCASPNPCTSPAGWSTAVSIGTVSNDQTSTYTGNGGPYPTSSTRTVQAWRPNGLAANTGNLAPGIIDLSGGPGACNQGSDNDMRITPLAAAHKFVVISPSCGPSDSTAVEPCTTGRCFGPNWYKKWITNAPLGTARTAGATDIPLIAAVYNYITQCPATPNPAQCIDPKRVWIIGDSSLGAMPPDALCSSETSNLIRGGWINSTSIELGTSTSGIPNCPNPPTRASFLFLVTGQYDNVCCGDTFSHFWGSSATQILGDTDSVTNQWTFASCGHVAYWGGGSGCASSMTGQEGCTGGITVNAAFIPAGGSPSGTSHHRADSMGPCATGVVAGSAAAEGWNLAKAGHGAGCQDSDITADIAVGFCSFTATIQGGTTCSANAVSNNRCPNTNNWYGANQFVQFMEQAAWTGQ